MNNLFEIFATVGVAGVLAIGIWVGVMQSAIVQHAGAIVNLSKMVMADHDLLLGLKTCVEANTRDIAELKIMVKNDHDLLIEMRAKLDIILESSNIKQELKI